MSGLGEFLSSTAGGSVAGAAADIGSGLLSSYIGRKQQERLFDYQQEGTLRRMRELGATPASMIQAFNGAVGGSMPSVSPATPMTSLGSNLVEASKVESENNRREVENQYDRIKMEWDPKRWRSDIERIKSETFKNASENRYFSALKGYYNEFSETLRQKRPWEISTMSKGLQVAQAQIEELQTRKEYNRAAARNQDAQGFEAESRIPGNYESAWSLQWENGLRRAGFDPASPLWQNLGRMAFTDPEKVDVALGTFQTMLGNLDNRFKDDFGNDYKRRLRNIGLAFGLARGMRGLDNHMWNRTEQASRIMGNIMPFVSPRGGSFVPSSSFSDPNFLHPFRDISPNRAWMREFDYENPSY